MPWGPLERHLAGLRERGLDPEEIVAASKGVGLSKIEDFDGNEIGIIGGFRVEY